MGNQISQQSAVESDTQSDYFPNPNSYDTGDTNPNKQDSDGNLICRSAIVSDEGSFRHTFESTAIIAITGTVTFTNGETLVTGSGTAFLSELNLDMYLRKTTDGVQYFAKIAKIVSDEELYLVDPYEGTSGSDGGTRSLFRIGYSGTGASISVTGGEVLLSPGTSATGYSVAYRDGDYLPIRCYGDLDISQRVANQVSKFGLMSEFTPGTAPEGQAVVIFDGANNTRAIFRTSKQATIYQDTAFTLPKGFTTAQHLDWEIKVLASECVLTIEGRIVAKHTDKIPGPYQVLNYGVIMENSAVVTSTTLSMTVLAFHNHDVVQIGNSDVGTPIKAEIIRKPGGFVFGQKNTASTSTTLVYSTAYTAPTSNAQRSIKSASANDAAAGTGARTVRITYLSFSGTDLVGPFTEIVTLNGTTAVNTINTDIGVIEKLEVLTAGSTQAAAGVITLYSTTGGGGSAVWSIAAGATDTESCHHYVASGKTCFIKSISFCTSGTVAGNGAIFWLTRQEPTITDTCERRISDILSVPGITPQTTTPYPAEIDVEGPVLIRGWCKPASGASYVNYLSFNYNEEQ